MNGSKPTPTSAFPAADVPTLGAFLPELLTAMRLTSEHFSRPYVALSADQNQFSRDSQALNVLFSAAQLRSKPGLGLVSRHVVRRTLRDLRLATRENSQLVKAERTDIPGLENWPSGLSPIEVLLRQRLGLRSAFRLTQYQVQAVGYLEVLRIVTSCERVKDELFHLIGRRGDGSLADYCEGVQVLAAWLRMSRLGVDLTLPDRRVAWRDYGHFAGELWLGGSPSGPSILTAVAHRYFSRGAPHLIRRGGTPIPLLGTISNAVFSFSQKWSDLREVSGDFVADQPESGTGVDDFRWVLLQDVVDTFARRPQAALF